MKLNNFYTLILLFCAQITMAQTDQVHSARISITTKATANSSTSYQRLLGEEALAFDLGDFLKKHKNHADIKVRGTMVKDAEVVRLSFNSSDWDGQCYDFCEKTVGVDKMPLLGVATVPSEGEIAGVIVQRVIDASSATEAGILPGDILTNIEGESVYSGCDLHTVINAYETGDALDVSVVRNGRNVEVPVILGYKIKKNVVWTNCCKATPPAEIAAAAATADLSLGALEVYPNPTTGVAQIKYQSAVNGNFSLKVTDVTGRVLYDNQVAAFSGYFDEAVDLTGQAAGIYFLQILHEGETRTEKIILQGEK